MKPTSKSIITIQHTESVHHTNGMIGSWTDWELTAKGKAQAEQIGKNLAKEYKGITFTLYASTLLRAKETAEIIGRHLSVKPCFTRLLMERNLGSAVGKSVEWLRANIEKEEITIDDKCFGDAESRRDVWNRLYPFYKEILNSESAHILLVSHGDTLSVLHAMWLGLNVEFLNHGDLYGLSGGVSVLQRNHKGKHLIKRLSDMSYLTDQAY